eukprot:6475291-Amphidinium_carterae.1
MRKIKESQETMIANESAQQRPTASSVESDPMDCHGQSESPKETQEVWDETVDTHESLHTVAKASEDYKNYHLKFHWRTEAKIVAKAFTSVGYSGAFFGSEML